MEEARPGVDYHPDGCDVGWMLGCSLAAFAVAPIMLVIYLLVAARGS
jgi:hypothetical protein